MRKVCVIDGTQFEAKRPSAKYCSERCRKRAQRQPAAVIALPARIGTAEGDLTSATRRTLEAAGRDESELGAAALLAAKRLDSAAITDTAAGVAALMKEYRATLADAMKDAERDDDALEQIRQSAAVKLIRRA
jgi:hypothetical protein